MHFLKLTWVLCLVVTTECSTVIDESTKGIYINDYCPRTKNCPEGTHVLCLYYADLNKMSPRCGDGMQVDVSEIFVSAILDHMNGIRKKVAIGEELGKNQETLPKAYGLLKVQWDPELATFAQIWANQCILRHDLCRATKKFSNPSQVVYRRRFKYPDWDNLNKFGTNESEPGFSYKKVLTCLDGLMMHQYLQKKLVTKEMINQIPENFNTEMHPARTYLSIVGTTTTHVGCGISTTTVFTGVTKDLDEPHVHTHDVQIVCNFAGSVVRGQKVYETDPPKDEGWTEKCGCPPGYHEDEDCLCVEEPLKENNKTENIIHTNKTEDEVVKTTCGTDDEPSVILLPIFTVENAPLEKLYHPQPRNSSSRRIAAKIFDTPHYYGTDVADTSLIYNYNVKNSRSYNTLNKRISNIVDAQKKDFIKRYFDDMMSKQRYRKSGSSVLGRGHGLNDKIAKSSRRDSIFTRVSKFKLPVQNNNNYLKEFQVDGNTFKNKTTKIIQDVTPRKDFSKVQYLATAYLKKRHNKIAKHENHNVAVKNEEQFIRNSFRKAKTNSFQDFNIPPTNNRNYGIETERDKKFSGLLANPDKEVNHDIKNKNIKEMIYLKMHKINGNILGNTDHLLQFNHQELPDDLIDNIENKNRINKLKFRDKGIMLLNFDNDTRSIKRKNYFKLHDKPSFVQYQKKYGIFDTDDRDVHVNYFEKVIKPYIEGRTIDKYTDSTNKNNDGYQNPVKMKNKNYFLHAYHQLEAKRNFFRDRLDKLDRQIQTIRGNRHRNEEYRDNGHHARPVIDPRDYQEKSRFIDNEKIF